MGVPGAPLREYPERRPVPHRPMNRTLLTGFVGALVGAAVGSVTVIVILPKTDRGPGEHVSFPTDAQTPENAAARAPKPDRLSLLDDWDDQPEVRRWLFLASPGAGSRAISQRLCTALRAARTQSS